MFECICHKQFEIEKDYKKHLTYCKIYRQDLKQRLDHVNLDDLRNLYYQEENSISEISKILGFERTQIEKLMKNNDFRFKTHSEACSGRAVREKRKKTCLEKYGVEYISQVDDIKQKKIETTQVNYGVDNPFQSKEIISLIFSKRDEKFYAKTLEKSKKTCLERYGVEHALQSPEFIEKSKKTCLERYGVEHGSKDIENKKRRKITCLEKYEHECSMHNTEIQKNIRLLHLERYGVEHALQSPEIREKVKKTCLEKYGVENPLTAGLFHKPRYTKIHQKIVDAVNDLGFDFEIEYRVQPYFVDVFLPELNLCIEAYGDYWHGNPDKYKSTDLIMGKLLVEDVWERDENRKQFIISKGYKFINFWESDINSNIEKVKKNIKEISHEN